MCRVPVAILRSREGFISFVKTLASITLRGVSMSFVQSCFLLTSETCAEGWAPFLYRVITNLLPTLNGVSFVISSVYIHASIHSPTVSPPMFIDSQEDRTQKVDIDIVLMPSRKHTQAAEKLSDEFIVPICSEQTSKKISALGDLCHLEPINIVGYDDHWSRYMNHFDLRYEASADDAIRLQVDTSVLACELAAFGTGCAVLIERFARGSIAMGKDICIVGGPIPLNQSHYFANTENEEPISAEIEALKQWIRIEFSKPYQ